ncbi:delta(1)-pyrroline-2-carboxylate reductase family protein [Pseudomonas sp. LJDD11]|uniref:bifunctional Delta(1)-pyrroline-2-carboxylate/Delta(1)-piperideine-2- carboxylate reductase n=1 Tax=Pseudomonas sp. LJDD11 TaxID=2931984 RepID=UPI00211C2810|nr:bifunctional Delta(1)-pyrroline-2-carboxylate/Delta(1)-piperideine-2-carboxylate reductase [Pseudomonas sp. LJDD11]MCQ9422203.1 delta(1)-pyrroline-2-carboxylate reductase family protein [Pseudomonas sp. LJDD11]
MSNPATATDDGNAVIVCDRERTAQLLAFPALVQAIAQAAQQLEAGQILSPERLVVPMGSGVMLSMPATAADIGIHKLVNVHPNNAQQQLPSIHGTVSVCDAATGRIRCLLDGPEVTGRRTAAVSLLAIRTLLPDPPTDILLYGTGVQARYHVQALNAVYPDARIRVKGRDARQVLAFCSEGANLEPCPADVPDQVQVVITLTTSLEPIYNQVARAGRLVIGVGAFKPEMAEIGKLTLDGSAIYVDEPAGAHVEAGDLLRAGVDWSAVISLAAALRSPQAVTRPAVFKSVGTGAWDLAAGRVALAALNAEQSERKPG